MGLWHISIEGAGPHDTDSDRDVEQFAVDFVTALQSAGHTVGHATVTIGNAKKLVDEGPDYRAPVKVRGHARSH